MTANVLRYCKLEEEHDGENAFDVSRPNILSNPYTHIKNKKTKAMFVVKTREEAISLYDKYFDNMLLNSKSFKEEWDKLYHAYMTFDTIYLGCYCRVDQNCHADVIIKKLKQRALKDLINKIKKGNHHVKKMDK